MKRPLFLFLLLFAPFTATAQTQPDPLFTTIKSLDTQLFDAYNHCDLTTLGSMVSDDLEFYHDQTGLSVGKAPFIAAIKQNICGKVHRTLIEDTLEVNPSKTTAPSNWASTASAIPHILKTAWATQNSSRSGKTSMASGKSPASSATNTTRACSRNRSSTRRHHALHPQPRPKSRSMVPAADLSRSSQPYLHSF